MKQCGNIQTGENYVPDKGVVASMILDGRKSRKDKMKGFKKSLGFILRGETRNMKNSLNACSGHIEALCGYNLKDEAVKGFNAIIKAYDDELFENDKQLRNYIKVYLRKYARNFKEYSTY